MFRMPLSDIYILIYAKAIGNGAANHVADTIARTGVADARKFRDELRAIDDKEA